MKVFVAGASGVIGGPLVRQLVAAGHEVTGTTSKPENAAADRSGRRDARSSATRSTPRRCKLRYGIRRRRS